MNVPIYIIEYAKRQEEKLLASLSEDKANIEKVKGSGLSEDLIEKNIRHLEDNIRRYQRSLRKIRIPLGTSRSKDEIFYRDEELYNKEKDNMYAFNDDLPEFSMGCNEAFEILVDNKVITEDDGDSESGCIFLSFKTREEGEAFIDRFNKFLQQREAVSHKYGLYED